MKFSWKIVAIILLVILFGLAIFVRTKAGKNWIAHFGTTIPGISTVTKVTPTKTLQPVRMTFVGDIMLDRGVKSSVVKNYNGDYSKLFEKATFLHDADITFANLEGTVTDVTDNTGSEYSFQMNPIVLPMLKNLGFNIVSFANNHVGDRNVAGFVDTMKRLGENNIAFTGAGQNHTDASMVKIVEKNGMKIGFLGFSDVGPDWIKATDTAPGILLASDPNRLKIISDAKTQVDFLIVSYHWGVEYKPYTDRQKSLAESSVDAGADLIIGSHPHVIQDYEEYKGKLIFYSLGNFMFDQPFSADTLHGLIVNLTINPNGTYNNLSLEVSQQDKTFKIIEIRPFERDNDAVLKAPAKTAVTVCPKPKDPNQTDQRYLPVSNDLAVGSYIPSNLQPIPKTLTVRGASTQCLTEATVTALEQMNADAKTAKLSLVISSAYRSSVIQKTLFTNSQTANPDQEFPSVAMPEHSEHQLGTAIDFRSGTTEEFTLAAFGKSPEYTWLKDNAYKYGFVQSYPAGTEKITGYAAEPWHWRYVGVDYATQIRNLGITPYEFLKNLIK